MAYIDRPADLVEEWLAGYISTLTKRDFAMELIKGNGGEGGTMSQVVVLFRPDKNVVRSHNTAWIPYLAAVLHEEEGIRKLLEPNLGGE